MLPLCFSTRRVAGGDGRLRSTRTRKEAAVGDASSSEHLSGPHLPSQRSSSPPPVLTAPFTSPMQSEAPSLSSRHWGRHLGLGAGEGAARRCC